MVFRIKLVRLSWTIGMGRVGAPQRSSRTVDGLEGIAEEDSSHSSAAKSGVKIPGGANDSKEGGAGVPWSRSTKNQDVSTGPLARPFARSLAPLTRSLAPLAPFTRLLARSLTPSLVGK